MNNLDELKHLGADRACETGWPLPFYHDHLKCYSPCTGQTTRT
jgi:hypothetical protein